MRRVAAVLMALTASNFLAYTADELAAKNVEAKGMSTNLLRFSHYTGSASYG
jgi:Zn-dependent protease with chaperone function